MLSTLHISNIVLIEKLNLEFERGLCALTGETGAGKSILLDALSLALGGRADAGLVRKGETNASVSALFQIHPKHPALKILKEQDIAADGDIILRRTLSADGRSKAYINNEPVSVGFLKTVGDCLIEIHGQFDTHSLLNPKYHLGLLDDFGVDADELETLGILWWDYKNAVDAYIIAADTAKKARAEEQYLRAALEVLDELNPQSGEEEKLTLLRARLMKREQNIGYFTSAARAMEDAENNLHTAYRAIEKTGAGSENILSALDRTASELKESMAATADISVELEECEHSLTDIDDRLFSLKSQARKLACAIDDLPAKRDELAEQLNLIEHQDDILAKLAKAREFAQKEFMKKARDVHALRVRAAKRLDHAMAKELPPLKLDKARFETSITELPENAWHEQGMSSVQFTVATNAGTAAGPLNKIASGGEMARFMLALKVVLAQTGTAGTLVFDEVDSGIGGATAAAVGERLARLSADHQVLVVTHSPQVAARAHAHYIVAKSGKTQVKTDVMYLPDTYQRREEIARMLAGEKITDEARAAASKLLEANAA